MISRKEAQILEEQLKKIQQISNAGGMPHYDLSRKEEFKIDIKIDNKVGPAQFIPDPKMEGRWLANELTFRAMKKDIFLLDNEMLDLKDQIECNHCSQMIDKQFWSLCPYCGKDY